VALSILTLVSAAAPKPRTHTVVLRGMKNVPATLAVNVGDTVVWKNDDVVPHTATDTGKSFDSGNIEPGASWSYVVKRKGAYSYYCAYHPNTRGRLVVR
jgi:plastocyanin